MRRALTILSVALIALIGCTTSADDPERTVQLYWDALLAGDTEEASQWVSEDFEDWEPRILAVDREDIFDEAMERGFLDRVELTTTGHSIENETATVNVVVTWPDVQQLMSTFLNLAMEEAVPAVLAGASEDELDEILQPIFLEVLADTPDVTVEHTAPLALEDGRWKLAGSPVPDPADTLAPEENVSEEPEVIPEVSGELGDPLTLQSRLDGVEVRVTVLRVIDPVTPEEPDAAPDGHRYLAVELQLESVGTEQYLDSPGMGGILVDDAPQQYREAFVDVSECVVFEDRVTLDPGEEHTRCVVFEVPEDNTAVTFHFSLDRGHGPQAAFWTLAEGE